MFKIKKKKVGRRFKQSILLHLFHKKKKTNKQLHLRTSNDFAHLAELAPVVQKIDNPIHSTNLYPVDSAVDPSVLILLSTELHRL